MFNSLFSFYWSNSFGFKYSLTKSAVSASQLCTSAQDKNIRLTSKNLKLITPLSFFRTNEAQKVNQLKANLYS